ncbi:MAG: cupin domain-containing protein [Saprospiraceae bacterium]
MPFVDFNTIPHLRIWDGVHGALYHSDKLTFGHITLEKDAVVKMHHHVHEQWTHVLDGELEFTLGDETQILTCGMAAYIPSDVPHCARAITKVKLIDYFMPSREDFKTLEPWKFNN